jgi:hypothetical protein
MRAIIFGADSISTHTLLDALNACDWTDAIEGVVTADEGRFDDLVKAWAAGKNLPVTIVKPAEWKRGKGEGHRRNQRMLDVAEALIAIPDGRRDAKTTAMIHDARKAGVHVFVYDAKSAAAVVLA